MDGNSITVWGERGKLASIIVVAVIVVMGLRHVMTWLGALSIADPANACQHCGERRARIRTAENDHVCAPCFDKYVDEIVAQSGDL